MLSLHRAIILLTVLTSPLALADTGTDLSDSPAGKSCEMIAKACSAAGFTRTETPGKKFWQDCMKPALIGRAPTAVTLDVATVQSCRAAKIEELKKELSDLEKAS